MDHINSLYFRTDSEALLFFVRERVSEIRITYETSDFRRYQHIIAKDISGNDLKMKLMMR